MRNRCLEKYKLSCGAITSAGGGGQGRRAITDRAMGTLPLLFRASVLDDEMILVMMLMMTSITMMP